MYLSKYFNLALVYFLHYIYPYFLPNLSAPEYWIRFFGDGLRVTFLGFFLFSVFLEISPKASDMMMNFQKIRKSSFSFESGTWCYVCHFRYSE